MNNVTKPSAKPPTEHPFKDKATSEKVVEITPDVTGAPIKGIDPPDHAAITTRRLP